MTDPDPGDGQNVSAPGGVLLQARGVTIGTHAGENLLSDISFHIEPGELIALTGVGRPGKSILLQSLAGLVRPVSGEILIDGVNLYANLRAFRASIGYVPAEFTLPLLLTVTEIMEEEARLRLPRRTSPHERKQKIATLLATMSLTQVANRRAALLNPAERRFLSMAVELLSSPGLLLLDQPVEPLTPFEEVQITILLRQLSRQGLTVIQVDQRARSAGLSDKVIVLAPGGGLAWFGPASEAFTHFQSLVPRGVAKDLFALKEAIELLANPQSGHGTEWAKRFQGHESYQKYVDDPLNNRYPDLLLQTRPLLRLRLRSSSQEKLPPPVIPRANSVQKLTLLNRRNSRLLWREKTLFSMLAIPPLIALVDFVFSSALSSAPERAPVIVGVLVFLVLLTAALLVQNEISKETMVYRHENRITPLLIPYILSKVWLVGVLALYQALVWTIVHFLATGMSAGLQALIPYGMALFLTAITGGVSGLIVSAMPKKASTATNWLLLLTVPQLLFSGAILPLENLPLPLSILAGLNPARYALDALLIASGYKEGVSAIPVSHWFAFVIMILGLMVALVWIQKRAGSVRT